MPTRRCAIYARISVAQEASVSLDRQVEAAEQYAAARGWEVVATFRDEGVSATHNKPEVRAGWRALLESPKKFDAVIVWKVDRLARRVLDFLNADQALQSRGAGIVCVEQTIDMTTPEGRGFAQMLAVFGEMEAAAIAARVAAARSHLLRNGRVVGGKVPFGWRSVPHPAGAGRVLAQDPDRIDWVRGAADRALRGDTIYSILQWLNEEGAPRPTERATEWGYSSVERLLRHPILAGLTPFNPGSKDRSRGAEVLRDADGLPVVDESVAIMPVAEWRKLVRGLDERDTAQSKPRALRAKTSGLLSGLVRCGHCDGDDGQPLRMHRGTSSGRPGYYCPNCHQVASNFEAYVVEQFLWAKGERVRWSVVEEVHEGGAALLPEIEHRLAELSAALQATDDDAEADRLTGEIGNLRRVRREARAQAPQVIHRPVRHTQTFGEDWEASTEVEDQRAVLDDALESVIIRRGRVGRGLDKSRFAFTWKMPDEVGPLDVPTDEVLAGWVASEG